MTSAGRSLTQHNSGQSLQRNGSVFLPSTKSMRVLHQNLYCSSFAWGMMGQVKMIRRCIPVRQNYQCLWCTPERQNFNASQTQPAQLVYSRTNCMGSAGEPTRSSSHTCAVQSPGFSNTVGPHTTSFLHLKEMGITGFAQRFSKT